MNCGKLEAINLAITNKAKSEAESEKMLAVAAIEDAEARGRYASWLWNEISYIDQNLAEAEHWLSLGWLSKAVGYFKIAFWFSQRTTTRAYDWSWDISFEDWVDQLEENRNAFNINSSPFFVKSVTLDTKSDINKQGLTLKQIIKELVSMNREAIRALSKGDKD